MAKRNGLFLPDERCLGGAMELNTVYNHWLHSTASAKEGIAAQHAESNPPTAKQLSIHRARKLAQSDSTAYNHMLNLHHMSRRIRTIQRTGSLSPCGRKEHQCHTAAAATAAGGQAHSKAGAVLDLCPWLPRTRQGPDSRRPATAPGALASGSYSGGQDNQQPADWQLFKQYHQPLPQPPVQPVQLPPSRYYAPGPSLLPSVQYRLYKASIMQDILQRQLYRAVDIRALCQHYIAVNPLEHRELLREVVADVLHELDIE